jgi:hypothetical protein
MVKRCEDNRAQQRVPLVVDGLTQRTCLTLRNAGNTHVTQRAQRTPQTTYTQRTPNMLDATCNVQRLDYNGIQVRYLTDNIGIILYFCARVIRPHGLAQRARSHSFTHTHADTH